METKEAIEFLDHIVELLEEGEVYKQMWESEKKRKLEEFKDNNKIISLSEYTGMEILEQKHFPKEAKTNGETKVD